MRRKSSAGNLFNFRNPSSSSNPLSSTNQLAMYPAPLQMGGFMTTQPSIPTSAASSHSTDTASTLISPTGQVTPVGREWDQQSASESNPGHSSVLSSGSVGTASSGLPPNQLDLLKETMNKRIMTLTYLRSTHEGKMYWFNTILLTRDGLSEAFNQPSMKKKAYRLSVLAMSLASLFDIQIASDYLKALVSLMTEYEAFQDETVRPKVKKRNLFRASKVPKRGGVIDYAGATYDADSYLVTPNVLDYPQTIISLTDILSETYQKLSKNLGTLATGYGPPSTGDGSRLGAQTPGPYGQQTNMFHGAGTPQMFGPLGVITPYPGLTSLWPGGTPPADEMNEGSLWSLASSGPAISVAVHQSATVSLAKELENIKTIDSKLKKVIASLLKELDVFARAAIKAELESLDPLLKNLVLPDQMQGDGADEY
ncbi:hypothetical protein PIIN_07293 [Serendipita indica DSM 11827]|uniref:Uncharacterized protein n=1 Tax=Serendipita indica (strain DSM 11827) TaxID=1109443 RepID=G4TPU5_SERID|nr:hypothetical protein PIIN_07293 [Serendipita indica DSM 11827]